MNLTKRLKVEPGSKVKLSRIDPGFHGTHKSEDEGKAELQHNLSRITDLQRKLYVDRRHCLLIVLQGIDGAGKDGTCWHVVSAMDPQGVKLSASSNRRRRNVTTISYGASIPMRLDLVGWRFSIDLTTKMFWSRGSINLFPRMCGSGASNSSMIGKGC